MQAGGKRPRTGTAVGSISEALDEFASYPSLRLRDGPRQQLAELFATLDRDGDGLLRPDDLPRCWSQVSAELDSTAVGEISPRDFVANMQRLALARPCTLATLQNAAKTTTTHNQLAALLVDSLDAALLEVCNELRALAMNSRYARGPVIGEGAFAVVRRATECTTGAMFALKLVLKSTTTDVEFGSELAVLRKVGRHERLAGLVESWEDRDSWALLLDLTSGCEVFDAIASKGFFSEADASTLIRQLCGALSYIHGLGIVHRDIKPENILLRERHASRGVETIQLDCVLCDFGLAATAPARGCVGTTHYMCPELFQDAPYSTGVDMFATGVVLFNLLSGTQPFDVSGGLATDEVVQGNIEALNWSFNGEGWKFISREAQELITSLLLRDPDKRPSAYGLLSSCRWVQGDAPSTALHRTTTKSLAAFNNSRRIWRSAAYACALVVGLSRPTIGAKEMCGHAASQPQSSGNRLNGSSQEDGLLKTDVESRTVGVRAAFEAIDTDDDGMLSRSELLHVIRGFLGPEAPHSEVEDAVNTAFSRMDEDLDGFISFDEFASATAPFSRDTLRAAFDLFDTDQNGSITLEEFSAMLHRLRLLPRTAGPLSQEIAALFEAADKDKSGSVSFEEFVLMLPVAAAHSRQSCSRRWQQQTVAHQSQSTLVKTFRLATVRPSPAD